MGRILNVKGVIISKIPNIITHDQFIDAQLKYKKRQPKLLLSNAIKEITYNTFGNILSDTNQDFKVSFGFAGGLYDSDTKLTRFGYRDYDAYTGKWTAKDPIDFAGGDTNLYGYVLGDPVSFVDPEGLFPLHLVTRDKIADKLKHPKIPKSLQDFLMPPAQCIDNALHHNVGPNIPIDVLVVPKIKLDYIGISVDISF